RARRIRAHPQSPVPASERSAFRARHVPHDPALRFAVPIMRDASSGPPSDAGRPDPSAASAIPVSTGSPLAFRRIGWVDIPLPAGERRLALHWLEQYGGGLFLAFRDTPNGKEP